MKLDEKLITEMHIEYMKFTIEKLNELGWEIYGKQNLNTDEMEIDYENKKIIF